MTNAAGIQTAAQEESAVPELGHALNQLRNDEDGDKPDDDDNIELELFASECAKENESASSPPSSSSAKVTFTTNRITTKTKENFFGRPTSVREHRPPFSCLRGEIESVFGLTLPGIDDVHVFDIDESNGALD